MAAITKIEVRIITGDRGGAGTDGDVYLGLGGREFFLDAHVDDFEQGSDYTYVLGSEANVNYAEFNDPRAPQLDTADLDAFPKYIRFEPSTVKPSWDLEQVTVTVNPGPDQVTFGALEGDDHLWLGPEYGKFCYLR